MAAQKDKSQAMIDKILTTAARLFSEKGEEKTSMQAIAQTAGISKGAIYHHFKSKDEIVAAVMTRETQLAARGIRELLDKTQHLTGKEQLEAILAFNLREHRSYAAESVKASKEQDPGFVLTIVRENMTFGAPLVADIIRKGVADGSLQTDFPEEAAETFLLLANFWLDGRAFHNGSEPQKLMGRARFLQRTMRDIGIDVLSDDLLDSLLGRFKGAGSGG